jgi:hypothetical protein
VGGTINGQKEWMRTNNIYPFQKEDLIIDATSWAVDEWKEGKNGIIKSFSLLNQLRRKIKDCPGTCQHKNQLWIILTLIRRY